MAVLEQAPQACRPGTGRAYDDEPLRDPRPAAYQLFSEERGWFYVADPRAQVKAHFLPAPFSRAPSGKRFDEPSCFMPTITHSRTWFTMRPARTPTP
jgi:hypothetical protein